MKFTSGLIIRVPSQADLIKDLVRQGFEVVDKGNKKMEPEDNFRIMQVSSRGVLTSMTPTRVEF